MSNEKPIIYCHECGAILNGETKKEKDIHNKNCKVFKELNEMLDFQVENKNT